MNIIFTICSINYLAQAKTLGDSALLHNPAYKFVIALVDRIDERLDKELLGRLSLLPIEQVGVEGFTEMYLKYDITELNTAVKPSIIKYLLKHNPHAQQIIYLDPDIVLYSSLKRLEDLLAVNDIVLTPHIFTPIHDSLILSEQDILNAGIFNLGFIAMRRSSDVAAFLDWWEDRLRDRCYMDFAKGLFVDQLWINFVPIFYKRVAVLDHYGYNVAYWNLHERKLSIQDGEYLVNETDQLVFFHFSGYNPLKPEILSKHQNRFTFAQRTDVVSLFEDYRESLFRNHFDYFLQFKCYFVAVREAMLAAEERRQQEIELQLQREAEERRILAEAERQREEAERHRQLKAAIRKRIYEEQKLKPTLYRYASRIKRLFS